MKIYVITKGCYSDYHICAVTEDKYKADLLVKRFTDNREEAHIEEYDTDDYAVLLSNNVYFCRQRKGEEIKIRLSTGDYINEHTLSVKGCCGGTLYMHVIARNEEQALKIALDRFAKYRAEEMGL